MAEVENLILEQLRIIRDDIATVKADTIAMRNDLHEDMSDLRVRMQSIEGVLFGLGGYMRSLDERVEHLEARSESKA